MKQEYASIKITPEQASEILWNHYNIKGQLTSLPGELDFNFKVHSDQGSYILKISRPNEDEGCINFQNAILDFAFKSEQGLESPEVILNTNGQSTSIIEAEGGERIVRLLSWMEGRLWSSVNPIREDLLQDLGLKAGKLTKVLINFDHPNAHRTFDWDVAQGLWTKNHMDLFENKELEIIQYFQEVFESKLDSYQQLRKSVVHNDANDNNVVVTNDLIDPKVKSIIDFGDSVYTQTINDLAIAVAYAIMKKPNPLGAAYHVVKGYHQAFELQEKELEHLYGLVAMRLVISVTKSAINKKEEPDNEYLLISEKPAWGVLTKWYQLSEQLVHYSFRSTCGYYAHPNTEALTNWLTECSFSISQLFPGTGSNQLERINLGVNSDLIGVASEENLEEFEFRIHQLQKTSPNSILAGGYQEVRSLYSTDDYKIESNEGPQYRTVHLGIDFWLDHNTPVGAVLEGTVISVHNNEGDKNYGPTIILEHTFNESSFYSLYGHLSIESLNQISVGDLVKQGDTIGFIGSKTENGNWVPHLHFQFMLDLLHYKNDFPGVCLPKELTIWRDLCPDPNVLFKSKELVPTPELNNQKILEYRKEHLGKSLSLSYNTPIYMVRGKGAYLIDSHGQKYLDTVNNVAHVGHEHPRVVRAGQEQMSKLNTNTRYLHNNINQFAENLLSTFPSELNVVHFVNSGSEANELALRMAKAYSGEKDMIAVEIGYHGNTNGCIDISSYKFDGKGGQGAPEHTHIVPLPDQFRGIYTGKGNGQKYAEHIQQQIEKVQSKGRNIAGFICESIISCGGQIELPEGYLKHAYDAVRKAGGLCISDEVQVGVGRVGSAFWGFQLHNVIPDIVTIGKPLGNGHPLAAVVCTKEVAEAFANGMEYFNTFGGNPVSCAIGNEVLNVVKEEKLQDNALKVGNYLKDELKQIQLENPIIQDIRGQGLFLGFELVTAKKEPLPQVAKYLANRMKDFNILMSTDGKDNNAIKIKPPIVFSMDHAREVITRLKQVLKEDYIQKI